MVTFTAQNNHTTCTFTGRLDTATLAKDAPEVDEKVGSAATGQTVVFDLDGITFVASSFLRLCLKTVHTVGPNHFSVRNLRPEIKKVFVIAGLDRQITIT